MIAGRRTSFSARYARMILRRRPVCYLRFRDRSGTAVYDWSGSGNDGAANGALQPLTAGPLRCEFSNSTYFPGTSQSDYVSLPKLWSATSSPRTVELWFKAPDMVFNVDYLFSSFNASGLIDISILADGTVRTRLNQTSGTAAITVASVRPGWNHVMVTWDGTTIRNYLNGVADGTGTQSSNVALATGAGLGRNVAAVGTNNLFAGMIGEFAAYDRVLTHAHAQQSYRMGFGLLSSGRLFTVQLQSLIGAIINRILSPRRVF